MLGYVCGATLQFRSTPRGRGPERWNNEVETPTFKMKSAAGKEPAGLGEASHSNRPSLQATRVVPTTGRRSP